MGKTACEITGGRCKRAKSARARLAWPSWPLVASGASCQPSGTGLNCPSPRIRLPISASERPNLSTNAAVWHACRPGGHPNACRHCVHCRLGRVLCHWSALFNMIMSSMYSWSVRKTPSSRYNTLGLYRYLIPKRQRACSFITSLW